MNPLSAAEACARVQAWTTASSSVVVEPAPRRLPAALALERDAAVVTCDSDFARFPGVGREAPAPLDG